MSFDDIKRQLRNADCASLIGLHEDPWFEAKQQNTYDLDAPTGRYELAKDACAFANAEGGFIVIGLRTAHLQTENADRVDVLDLCSQVDFVPSKYEGIIGDHVKPSIAGLDIRWQACGGRLELGLGIIEIPAQEQRAKPFLIVKIVEDNAYQKQIIFGMSRRNQSSNDPLSFDHIQRALKIGLNPDADRLSRIEAKVDTLVAQQSAARESANAPPALLDQRMDALFEDAPE
jgi:hypothetical protein